MGINKMKTLHVLVTKILYRFIPIQRFMVPKKNDTP